MRVLWVTRLVPHPPFRGGDAIYSARLIESLAATGIELTVLCHDNGGGPPPQRPNVNWVVVPLPARRRFRSLFGRLPAIVYRFSTPQIRSAFAWLLDEGHWDAVLIDNIAMAGTVDTKLRGGRLPTNTTLTYVSHNHEGSIRKQLAGSAHAASPRGIALRLDASKSARLERELVEAADLVTVNTAVDADLYRQVAPDQRYLVLTPGYDGSRVEHKTIDVRSPRRVVVLGSYGWVAKQLNVWRFLRAAAAPLAHAGIGIDVVGWAPDEFIARVRAEFPTVTMTGPVEVLEPVLQDARIGIVAEEIGGGFKHKVLDYVFHRIPVVALTKSVAGVPLVPGASMLEFPDLTLLVAGVIDAVDDVPRLNALQDAAYRQCDGRFDWADRGPALANSLGQPPPHGAPVIPRQ